MPIEHPLPEVVVIHKDEQFLGDIRSLEKFTLELNIKLVTESSDKASCYGVMAMAEIKQLCDQILTSFLDGEKLVIQGHIVARGYESPDEEMLEEGVAREVINRMQNLRKSAGLNVDEKVTMYYTP